MKIILLYIMEAIFLLYSGGSLIVYIHGGGMGFVIVALIFGVSAVLSFFYSAWWPLIIGGILAAIILNLSSNRSSG